MSENEIVKETKLTTEQVEGVSGGFCTWEDFNQASGDFVRAYENLVGLMSHIIGRMAGEP